MINSVSIHGYRGLRTFRLGDLGRINLLVGRNNSGKSSILEALFLLAESGDPFALWQLLSRRGERAEDRGERRSESEVEVSHLFSGHRLAPDATISISTQNVSKRSVRFVLREPESNEGPELFPPASGEDLAPRLVMTIESLPDTTAFHLPLSPRGGIRFDSLRRYRSSSIERSKAQYISTESLTAAQLTSMWGDIVLTDAEERVLTALRFLEPNIERIAATSTSRDIYYDFSSRGGFKVKLRGASEPIPIGSLGDGNWRMLAMAISLIRAKDGILLVDEIDTGLHFSVMEKMWQLISETARAFNVQVFATTHSYDCVRSLATICGRSPPIHASIQRIETEKGSAVPFDESEIQAAASHDIELR